MTLKNNRAPLLCYFKLCASLRSHWWIQTGVSVRKHLILVKINIFLAVWPCNLTYVLEKTIGLPSYHTSSFVHHFVAIGEFKLELHSGNAEYGSNSTILELCDLSIWRMTLKNNRATLLPYFKLCALFRSHWWIQTGVTVRKRPIWVKFYDFCSRVTLKFEGWPWKTTGHLPDATSSFVHNFVAIGESKLELQYGNT